eukprot:363899-Chlamydomonas_euryale.AAC.5
MNVVQSRGVCSNAHAFMHPRVQDVLLDRRLVYRKLKEHNIPVPTHIIVERDGLPEGSDPEGFVEDPDYVQFNGQRINKPFVEKPCDGENHNIYIYYPASMVGSALADACICTPLDQPTKSLPT